MEEFMAKGNAFMAAKLQQREEDLQAMDPLEEIDIEMWCHHAVDR